jgi:hypothetical protein
MKNVWFHSSKSWIYHWWIFPFSFKNINMLSIQGRICDMLLSRTWQNLCHSILPWRTNHDLIPSFDTTGLVLFDFSLYRRQNLCCLTLPGNAAHISFLHIKQSNNNFFLFKKIKYYKISLIQLLCMLETNFYYIVYFKSTKKNIYVLNSHYALR